MKINCACGAIIVDQSDKLPHKAHIIGDKDYLDFLDSIDAAIEDTSADKARVAMQIRRAETSRLAWECSTCGRLYLNDANNKLVAYLPENRQANRIFDRPRNSRKD
ncbi:hypothetical protein [Cypionkella aquatica]|nr:hypothetical protein [Cypionkella aquatica]